MASTAMEDAANVLSGTNLSDEQKSQLLAIIAKLDAKTLSQTWKLLVVGLLALSVLSIVAMGWAVLDRNTDTTPDLFLTTFTASLTGLIGLFVPQSK